MRRLQIFAILLAIIGLACSKPEASKSSSTLLAGTISIKPELQASADPLSVLFIIVRSSDGGIGAVKKLLPPFHFPINFEIGPGDLMIPGMELKGTLTPTARLDKDGNANPAQPGDVVGRSDPASAEIGSASVKIELNELVK